MSDKLVLVAEFNMPVEAHAAHGRLEAEGIRAVLTGGGSVNLFSGVQGLGGRIQLHVAETDADRAAGILAVYIEGHADDGEARPSDEAALWVCPLCGDAVNDDLSVCPSCETARPAQRQSPAVTAVPRHNPASRDIQPERSAKPDKVTADTPLEAVPAAVEDDLDLADMGTFVGDDLVRRAFLSSLFGVLVPYSFWLLARLAFYPGRISPRMMTRLYWTIALDSFWCLLLFLFVFRLFGPVFYR